jgi:hypothetical protein
VYNQIYSADEMEHFPREMNSTSTATITPGRPKKILFTLALFFTLWPTLRFFDGTHNYAFCLIFALLDISFLVSCVYAVFTAKHSVKVVFLFFCFLFFMVYSANTSYFLFKFSLMLYLACYFYKGFDIYSLNALKYSFILVLIIGIIQFVEANFLNTKIFSMNNINIHYGFFVIGSSVGDSYALIVKGLSLKRVSGVFEEPAHFVTALLILLAIFYRNKGMVSLILLGLLISFSGITFFSIILLIGYALLFKRLPIAWYFFVIFLSYMIFSAISFYLVPMYDLTHTHLSLLDRILGYYYWQHGTIFQKIFGYGGLGVCSSDLPEYLLRLSPEYGIYPGVCVNGEYSSVGSILQDYGVFSLVLIFLFLRSLRFNSELKLLILFFMLSIISFSYYAWSPVTYMFLGYIVYRYRFYQSLRTPFHG